MYKPNNPGGLVLPMHATLKGTLRWRVLDERGVPEAPRTPSGFAIGGVEGVEQDNLITNLGMDRIAELNCLGVDGSATTWRLRLAVGTGSNAPSVTDTVLDNEVQRDLNSGGFAPGGYPLRQLNTDANVWEVESLVTRVVTMTADRNLTEFGFANSTTGDILIRELLRDGGGTPITVSLLTGKSLRVDHTLYVSIPAPAAGNTASIDIAEYDAANELTSTTSYGVTYGFQSPSASGTAIASDSLTGGAGINVFHLWNPRQGQNIGVAQWRINTAQTYGRLVTISASDVSPSATGSTNFGVFNEWVSYVPGSYESVKRATAAPADGAGDWYGVFVGAAGNVNNANLPQFVMLFDSPATYAKADTDTLRFGVKSTWARA